MTPEQVVEMAAPRTSAVMPTRPFVQALIERTGGADLEAAALLAAESYKRNEVVALMVAAVASGRPCSARTVGRLLWFLPTPLFGIVLMHAEGDRVAAISAALESYRLQGETAIDAAAVALAEHGPGPLRPELARALRFVAKLPLSPELSAAFGSLLHGVSDPGVREAARAHLEQHRQDGGAPQALDLEPWRGRILELLPASSVVGMTVGGTIRCAEKVGRNEPCPCGSGRKFKKCCLDARAEADADPSPVAGLTLLEFKRQAHRHLDGDGLAAKLDQFDLAQLPLTELDTEQLEAVYTRLARSGCWGPAERALQALEERSDRGTMGSLVGELLNAARFCGEHELVARLAARGEKKPQKLLDAEIALMDRGNGRLGALEDLLSTSLRQLEGDDEREREVGRNAIICIVETALEHRPALGLMLARGAIATGVDHDLVGSMRSIELARDKLDMPPGDPIGEYVDDALGKRVDEGAEELLDAMRKENRRLAEEARTALDAMRNARGQSRRIRGELERARSELRGLEADLDVVTAPDPRVGELQRTVEELMSAAEQLEGDRVRLRGELAGMQSQLARPSVDEGAAEGGDELFDRSAVAPAFDHVLIPVWSPAAAREVGVLEPEVAARALDLVVRVASGRAGGVGARVKKLKGSDELWSTRLGIGHRVLFRFDAERGRLCVEHVVARKDLEKFLRRP